MVSEVIWSLLITSISGIILGLFTLAYKSKCTKISFCGAVIERNIAEEEKIDLDYNHTHNSLASV